MAVARMLQRVLIDAPAWDARLLGAAGVIMLAVAAVAAFIPARRAGAIDPALVLRDP